ncbi:MAG: HdeD family acid-resistance protein [Dehalococcoidia bacterium]
MNFDHRLSEVERTTKWWWVFLITGILWLFVSMIVFRFDITSVEAVGILIACVVIMAGVNEFLAIGVTKGGWMWVHAILGVIFIVFGIAAFVYPGRTFVTMASIMGWVLLFKGIFDIVVAFMTKSVNELWWLNLIVGIAEIALAFWAAGYFGRKVVILIAWVGALALLRGITEIILAFQVRAIHKQAERGTLTLPESDSPAMAAGQEGSAAPA